jgi:hypothetical protein
MEEKQDAIMWGWDQPTRQRSQEHREYLIAQYNKDKPKDKHVSTMEELEKELRKENQTK